MNIAQVIKNPLTMLGVFASLVEVAGSIVLPQLNGYNQTIYLLFLIVFPCGLVYGFFRLLWEKPTNLYAPGDYTSDNAFLKANTITDQTTKESTLEFIEKIEEYNENNQTNDLKNCEASTIVVDSDEKPIQKNEPFKDSFVIASGRGTHTARKYFEAEQLAQMQLCKMFGENIRREIVVKTHNTRYRFDALVEKEGKRIVIEIKYWNTFRRIESTIIEFSDRLNNIKHELKEDFNLVLFIVTDLPFELYRDVPEKTKNKLSTKTSIPYEIEIYNYEDLKRLNPGALSL